MPASPNNTLVLLGSTSAITDANGNKWTITSGGQVAVNGVADTTTANVIELAYENGQVWQENASKLWWSKTLPTDVWGPNNGTSQSPVPAAVTPASANNTVVLLGSTAAIVDASGNKWTITSGGQVAVNGVVDTTTAKVTEIAYENGVIWQENSSNLWWSKASPSSVWGPAGGTSTSPIPAASATLLVTPPSKISLTAGTSVSLAGAKLADSGIAAVTMITLQITDMSGAISMKNAAGAVLSGSASKAITVTDTLAALNADLATLTYSAAKTGGSDSVSINANAGSVTGSGSTNVTVSSANNTLVLLGSAAAIVDTSGNKWTITSGGQVAVNGVADTTTSGVIELAYESGKIWQENSNKLWWDKTLPTDVWGPNNGTATSPVPGATPAATIGVTAPASVSVVAGGAVAMTGVQLNDTGLAASAAISLTVTDTVGAISMKNAAGTAISGSGGQTVTVTDTLANLNQDLTTLTYTASAAAGSNTLSVKATSGGTSGAGSTTVNVSAAPQAASGTNDVGGASGQGGYLLPAGFLSTSGSQIVDSSGNPVRIASIGWNGTDSRAFAPAGLYAASYQSIIDSIKGDGFNTIRIPWSDLLMNASPAAGSINYSLNPDLQGLNSLQVLDKIVSYAGQDGLKIILDHHNDEGGPGGEGGQQPNGLWYDVGPGTNGTDGSGTTGTVTDAQFQADWVALASRYAGNTTVIGYDLDNEPLAYGGMSTWGDGSATDIQAMYERVGNAIHAVDPGTLIIAEGPQDYNGAFVGSTPMPFGDLTDVPTKPVVLTEANKVVYSIHIYPTAIDGVSPDSGAAATARYNAEFGFLYSSNTAPVFIGEMGASLDGVGPDSTGSQLADQQAWASTLLNYMNGQDGASGGPTFTGNQQPVSGSWWLAGAEAGQEPDGIQSSWGAGNYRPQQQSVTDQMLYKPTHIA